MISCLMVTQARKFEAAKRAILDFHRQTLKDRALVIVHDSGDQIHGALQRYVESFPDDEIRLHAVDSKQSLGELRNIAVMQATYPIVCQWDDDDLYHPRRLEIQFDKLQADRSDFCFFTDQLHWFVEKDWFFWDDWNVERYPMNLIQGTIMGYRDKLGRYPAIEKGEDTPVVVDLVARDCRISTLENQGYLYIYTYSGANVWDFEHHAAISEWKRYRLHRLEKNMASLSEHLAGYGFEFDRIRMPHDSGILEVPIARADPGHR